MTSRASADVPTRTEVPDTGLSSEPWIVALVVVVWAGVGLRVAVHEARRGHELRHLAPLAVLFGPFLIAYAHAALRRLETSAHPVVVREPNRTPTGRRVLVVLLGRAQRLADARPLLTELANDGAHITIVRPVTFDVARGDDTEPDHHRAARCLEWAGLLVAELDPGLVLLPGAPIDSVPRFVEDCSADLVLVIDDETISDPARTIAIEAAGPGRLHR